MTPSDDVPRNDEGKVHKQSLNLGEIGTSGLERTGNFIRDEFIDDLRGQKKYDVFREMSENDAVVGAMLSAISLLMRQVNWRVQPASNDRVDQQAAEFLEENRRGLRPNWAHTLDDILSMIPYGFSVHEIVYERREDGRIGWAKLPIRRQETIDEWDFTEAGDVKAVHQMDVHQGTDAWIPREKFLLFRPTSARANPEGRSALRNAYRSWQFRKHLEEIEAVGVERDLAGLPVAFVPPELLHSDASDELKAVKTEIENLVKNIRRDEQEGVVFPREFDPETGEAIYDLELLTSGGDRQFDTSEIINRYERQTAITVLADFILIGHEAHGSFALSSSKTKLFSVALGAWLDAVQDVLNQQAIPRLFNLNDFRIDQTPKLVHSDVETPDLEAIGQYIRNLSQSGIQLDNEPQVRNRLMDYASLPREQQPRSVDNPPPASPEDAPDNHES